MKKTDLKALWKVTLAQIEVRVDSNTDFRTWLKNTTLLEIQGKNATVGVKNTYSVDWLKKHHDKVIRELLSKRYGTPLKVTYQVDKSLANLPTEKISVDDAIKDRPIFASNLGSQSVNSALKKSNINNNYSFDSYIVGSSNKLAHAAALGVARTPGQSYNPLFIYGNTGLGKTHLSQAIGRYVLEKDPTKKIQYISSEGFLNDMVRAIRSNKNLQFRQKYRTLDLLIIDDIQFLSKWQETQNEFFNTFNVLYNAKKQIILISDRPPEEISKLEDRLRSRFQGGMTVDISRPDYATRLAILQQKSKELSIELSTTMLEQIATFITDNIRELEGALQKIYLYNSMHDTPLSKEEIATILGKDKNSKQKKVKPNHIIKIIGKEFNLTIKEIVGPRRTKDIALARQIAMYILREEFGYKLDQVANYVHRKDHTTVIHAVDKIKSKLLLDDGFKTQVEMILKNINE